MNQRPTNLVQHCGSASPARRRPLPAAPRNGRAHVAMTLVVGVLLASAIPCRAASRPPTSGEFAALTAAAPCGASFGFIAPADSTPSAASVFALPSLVVVAMVTVLVGSRLTHQLRVSRIGGLYGP